MEFTPKQIYMGRVIAPAKYFAGTDNRKPFISFVLSVNNLLHTKDESGNAKRESAKITCSYTVQSDNDMVAVVLSRIAGKDENTLGGESYKSVWVEVEGTERLVQVVDENGNAQRGYYKNLDFCQVNIPDTRLRELYKKEFGDNNSKTQSRASNNSQPNVAPSVKQVKKVVQQQEAIEEDEAPTFEIGHIEVDPAGKKYEYLGGDSSLLTSWKLVEEDVKPKLPFGKPTGKKQQKPVAEVLEEDDLDGSDIFAAVAGGKDLAV